MNNLRKILLFAVISTFTTQLVRAKEGMWFIPKNETIQKTVAIFDNGGTASLVSKDGLLLTNHHCGAERIQQISSNQHNYLKNGFWASSLENEIPIKGLTVNLLIRSIDVSKEVQNYPKSLSFKKIESNLQKEYGNSSKSVYVSLNRYLGDKYILSVYQTFNDIRLVGTPPNSIGNFGGDFDNFEWPRHSGDFCFFRIYANSNNDPANYSANNTPYQTTHFLKISLNGIKENMFTKVIGFPGSTQRHISSYELTELTDIKNPAIILPKKEREQILKKEMENDESIRLKYASKFFSSSNVSKMTDGCNRLIRLSAAMNNKRNIEHQFDQWIMNDKERLEKYEYCLPKLRELHLQQKELKKAHTFILNALGTDAFLWGTRTKLISKSLDNKNKSLLSDAIINFKYWYNDFIKEYDYRTDYLITKRMVKLVQNNIAKEFLPTFYESINKEYNGNIDQYCDDLYQESIFSTPQRIEHFLAHPSKKIMQDPMFLFGNSIYECLIKLKSELYTTSKEINQQSRLLQEGIAEMDSTIISYPDADFTMRYSIGKVSGASPKDGITYQYQTSLEGVIEKEDTTVYEYQMPKKLKELFIQKEYGIYGENGRMYTCFLSDNDIVAGNSGSPVLNNKDEIIGLAFDGNWESLASSIIYEPNKNRCINVDIRYVLFIVDKFANSDRLIKELTICPRK